MKAQLATARSTLARRIGIGVVAVCAVLTLGACAAGQKAQTAEEAPTIDGTTGSVGPMQLHQFALQAPTKAPSWQKGSDVHVDLVLVNTGPSTDTLSGIKTSAASGWGIYDSAAAASAASASSGAKSVAIPPAQRVEFGTPTSTKVLVLTGLTKRLYPGESVPITVSFAHAGSVTLKVPVQLTENPSEKILPTATTSVVLGQ